MKGACTHEIGQSMLMMVGYLVTVLVGDMITQSCKNTRGVMEEKVTNVCFFFFDCLRLCTESIVEPTST